MNKRLGYTAALVTMLSYSSVTPLAKAILNTGMPPTAMLAVRYSMLVVLMSLLWVRPKTLKLSRESLKWTLIGGVMQAVAMVCYFWGLKRLDSSIAAMLVSLNPLIVVGLLALRGERVTMRTFFRLGLGLAGVYILIGPGGDVDLLGALLVSITTVIYGAYLAMMQWKLTGLPPLPLTYYTTLVATFFTIVIWIIEGAEWTAPAPQTWFFMIVLVLLGTLVSRFLLFVAVSNIGSGAFALMGPLETLLAVIWSLLLLGDLLSPLQWIGGLFVLLSGFLAIDRAWRPRRRRRRFRRQKTVAESSYPVSGP
jgi:drug/metabolite transporter (DMT)-like permease